MRNLMQPRLEHLGVYQVGVRTYYVQRYYPNGGNTSYVYVFKKGDPSAKGIVFEDEEAFFDWADNAPKQYELFEASNSF
jgi:hypothetical protein